MSTPLAPVRNATATKGVGVRLTDLRRSYGTVRALDGLTLSIEPGELVALLGPSGCGKTTALRLLAGLEDADGGRVEVGGRDITTVPTNKRDMGMVFQAYSLFPHMTTRQNVEFGLQLRGIGGAKRRARATEMLELVGPGDPGGPLRPPALRRAAAAGRPGPGPRHRSRRCCCSTSRCPPLTPRSGCSCGRRSAGSSSRSGRRRCSSPTTRRRPSPSPTASGSCAPATSSSWRPPASCTPVPPPRSSPTSSV